MAWALALPYAACRVVLVWCLLVGAVATAVENARLLVVLYEAGGCVFTEATLQSLRLTADKVGATFFKPSLL